MVIFITNSSAYSEMKEMVVSGKHAVWLSAGVIQENEIEELRTKGVDLSVLDYAVDTSSVGDMDSAMSTIKEHHAGQNIWVQFENQN